MAIEIATQRRTLLEQKRWVKWYFFIKGTKKIACPRCGDKSFVPYTNVETGSLVDANLYGKCDHANRCGYYCKPPKDLNKEDKIPIERVNPQVLKKIDEASMDIFDTIPYVEFIESVSSVKKSTLYKFLCIKFEEFKVRNAFQRYMVGYNRKWKGSPVFWQIDSEGFIRTGKIIGYDKDTGKRIKEPYTALTWEHAVPKKLRDKGVENKYQISQCLFGEHLIGKNWDKINVVESEKTALICTIHTNFKELWLAVGGLEHIKNSLFRCLEGDTVIFHPDKGANVDKWIKKVNALDSEIRKNFKVSRAINKTDLPDGSDMADYILSKI